MRTKHLLYSAAMAALFAACVNDDFETISKQQNAANDGRPTVSDVKIEFAQAEDPATRVIFDGRYHWQTNDTIGALLMDNVKELGENKSWLEKYGLVEYIHTSYPFTYSTADQTWGCNTKMLEGNYFFAYPWESYDGQRQVRHSLMNQSQNGIGGNVVAESYADNQFFVGYSRIMAGAEAKDVLNTVDMISTLGAIQLRITNTGTQTRHINKVVLSGHDDVASVLTINPTNAAYNQYAEDGTLVKANRWNLTTTGHVTWFNYANYEGEESENELYKFGVAATNADFVYNREENDGYERNAALRAAVKTMTTNERSAQLVINGTAEERALRPNAANTAYVLIMCNPLKIVPKTQGATGSSADKNQLLLSIYTDEGFVQNIDLSEIHAESADYTVVTNSKIEEVGPSVSNTIEIQIDDNSFIVPQTMSIYNSADLLQFIKWNTIVAGTRVADANLMQDVTFTAEMLNALKANKNTSININGAKKLTLAEDVPANVLDEAQLKVSANTTVVVTKALALTEKSDKVGAIEIEEDAELSINDENAVLPTTITNNGALTLGANSAVSGVTVDNYGTMTVDKGGDSKATVNNMKDAVINNNGYMQSVTNNAEATIKMGENTTLANVKNSGLIVTAKGAVVTGTNNADGEIQYVSGANLTGLTNNGTTSEVFEGTIISKDTKFENISKIILNKAVTVSDATGLAKITEIEIVEGGVLTVSKDVEVSVDKLTISANGTVAGEGTVKAVRVDVEEGATLTNSGKITVSGVFTNNGTVLNNGSIATPNKFVAGEGTWKYNEAGDSTVKVDPKVTAMNDAVKAWTEKWDDADWSSNLSEYYGYQPYNVDIFIKTMVAWMGSSNAEFKTPANALYTTWKVKENNTNSWGEVLKDSEGKAVAEFDNAVLAVLTDANLKLVKDNLLPKGVLTVVPAQDVKLYDDEDAAYDALRTCLANPANHSVAALDVNSVAAAAWRLTNTELENGLKGAKEKNPAAPYTYIWKGSTVDQVVDLWSKATAANIGSVKLNGNSTGAKLVEWINEILNEKNPTAAMETFQDELKTLEVTILTASDMFGGYNNEQIKACANN